MYKRIESLVAVNIPFRIDPRISNLISITPDAAYLELCFESIPTKNRLSTENQLIMRRSDRQHNKGEHGNYHVMLQPSVNDSKATRGWKRKQRRKWS